MHAVRHAPVKTSLQPSNHPYLNGAWTPQHEEVDATDLDIIEGVIPPILTGSMCATPKIRCSSRSVVTIPLMATA